MEGDQSEKVIPGDNADNKSEVAKQEEATLAFWRQNNIFEKTLAKEASAGEFVFYDGPPFATGLPHYGHILASTIKDAIPRYQTMKGKRVARRWGWDCHGLPIENLVEKELGISGKKQIEEIGVEKFNITARSKVLQYVGEWKKTVDRIGRWVDFDGSYKTMDNTFMESCWWALAEMNKKGLLYEGTRVLPYCPRCETPIANSEIAMDNSYKDITDISVYAKFELVDEPGTFVLAWTTTPWTLPGNVALAINPEINYVKVLQESNHYIVARDLAEKAIKDGYEVAAEFSGKDLIGKSYKPVFDYYIKDEGLKNRENGWKIYGADFVTTESGTGVVHIAPGFGEDDMKLAQKASLPVILHVGSDGKFKPEVIDFAGELVKPKGDHQKADVEIIKNLAHRGLLFAKEKIIHSYPHCFRCETPLYYYAIPAWFIKIQDLKPRLQELNNDINWIPDHLKHGRFAKSMEGAPDWNISRNRFWATPLPIWKCEQCKQVKVVDSVADLTSNQKPRNNFTLMRHGQSESNVLGVVSGLPENLHHLTDQGKGEAKQAAENLKSQNVDLIFVSPLLRTKETAEIVAAELGLSADKVVIDDRLREVQTGDFNLRPINDYRDYFQNTLDKFTKPAPGGENLLEMKNRLMDFLVETDQKYQGQNILIITHEYSVWLLEAGAKGLDAKAAAALKDLNEDFVKTGEFKKLTYVPLPHNKNYELDLHRPYIDEVKFVCGCGGQMSRISEVVDCWFESGSMPFAAEHYPFENKNIIKERFPAQFVAEYIAQTRTWFYYMHAVSTVLFDRAPFENVVTTGTVLAEDGQKMSKSKGNFPDPWILFNKYGVDAIRFYLLASPIMKSEDLNFSEKGVDEVYKKVILRLQNVVALYQMYADAKVEAKSDSKNVLDQWMIARLHEAVGEVTRGLDSYELDKATRPFDLLVDDLSTWYVRRSRERFKNDSDLNDKQAALSTTKYVLLELSKLLAPVMPFLAERIYRDLGGVKESVHLENWPTVSKTGLLGKLFGGSADNKIIAEMAKVREIVSLGLEARATAKIKVRQPLARLQVKNNLLANYFSLIAEEVNVKEVVVDEGLAEEVLLDTTITPELEEEGRMRDLLREVQDLRKTNGLNPSDRVKLFAGQEHYDLAQKFQSEFLRVAGVVEIALDASADVRVEKV